MGKAKFGKCERLPFPLTVCPCCSSGIKFSRSFTWITPSKFLGPDVEPVCTLKHGSKCEVCVICNPPQEQHGLIWIGKGHYSPRKFVTEAETMGISRKLPAIPRGFKVGETVVYLAHIEACPGQVAFGNGQPKSTAGIFMSFMPTHVDLVVDDLDNPPDRALSIAERLGDDNTRIIKVIQAPEGRQTELEVEVA